MLRRINAAKEEDVNVRQLSRTAFLLIILSIAMAVPTSLEASGECYGSQQCNRYPETTLQYAGGYGVYCGGWGSGCSECVNADCQWCVTDGNWCATADHRDSP